MAGENVIRRDVVQIGFDIEDNPIQELLRLLNGVQSNANNMADSITDATDEIADMANSVNDVTSEFSDMESEMRDVTRVADDLAGSDLNELNDSVEDTTRSARDCEQRLRDVADSIEQVNRSRLSKLPQIIQSSASAARTFVSTLRANVWSTITEGPQRLRDRFRETVEEARRLREEAEETGDALNDAAGKGSGGFTIFKGVVADLISNGIQQLIGATKDFIKETIKVGADFDSSMSEVAAISGATGDELQALRDTAKEYGKSTVFSASESADALKYMALAGWDANQSIDALPGILNLAAASGMDLGAASDMVTDYLTAFNMEADQAAYFADTLAYAQSNSNTTAEQLGEAYKNCAASLNAAGQDMETTTALLSSMANQGLKGSEAGTALSAVMRDMTSKMEDGAIKIGDTAVAVTDAEGNFRDLTDILKDVESATDGMTDGQRASALQATFTEESLKGMNLMLNAGIGEAEDFEKALRDSTGTAQDMADTMNDNLNGDMKNFQSQLEGVRIELYEKLEPALRKGVGFMSTMLSKIGAVANKIVGWATSEKVVNNLKSAFQKAKDAVSPIVDAVGGVIEKIAGFVTSESTINAVKETFEKVKNVVEPIIGIVQQVIDKIAEFVTSEGVINTVKGAFEKVKTTLDNIFDAASKVFTFIKDHLDIILPLIVGIVIAWGAYKAILLITTGVAKAYAAVQAAVNTVMSANPVGIIIIAIGLLIGIIILLIKNWDKVKATATAVLDNIKVGWGMIATWFNTKVITPIVTFFTGLWTKIKTGASNLWTGVKTIFSTVANWVNTNIITPVVTFFTGLWTAITTIVSNIWTSITTVFGTIATWVYDNVISPVVTFFSGLWTSITEIFSNVVSWFSEKFTAAVDAITEVFSTVVEFFTGIWDSIKEIFTTIGTTIGNGIAEAFATVVNAIIDFAESTINGFIRAINAAIGLINEIPGVEISKISELSIPRLAQGGIVDKPTIAQIGEDGKEAVVPLENNLGWIKRITSGVLNAITAPNSSAGSYDRDVITSNNRTFNETNNYNPTFVLNMNGASATDDNKRKVKAWIKEALKETFDDLDKDNMPILEI